MAETPKWFEEDQYFAHKVDQLVATGSTQADGSAWTVDALKAYFADKGLDAYEHFQNYGNAENISPNAWFDVAYYLQAKADALNTEEGVDTWTAQKVQEAFDAHGWSAWDHYTMFGQKEMINPSKDFNTKAYFEAKAAALNANGEVDAEGNPWTAESVADYFVAKGVNAVEHAAQYMGQEGEVSSTTDLSVPAEEQAKVDPKYDPYTETQKSVTAKLALDAESGADTDTEIAGTLTVENAIEGDTVTLTVANSAADREATTWVATVGADGELTLGEPSQTLEGEKLVLAKGENGYTVTYTRPTADVNNYVADKYSFSAKGSDEGSEESTAAFATVASSKDAQELTTLDGDVLTGSDAGDLVVENGLISTKASETNFQAKDQIDGTASGDNDQLTLEMNGDFTGFTDGFMKSVETVNLTAASGTRTFDATNVTGTTTYNLKGNVNLAKLAEAGITVNMEGRDAAATIGFAADAVKGKEDALTLGLNGLGTVKDMKPETPLDVTADGIESLTLAAKGDNAVTVADNALTNLVVTGEGNLFATAAGAKLVSVEASEFSGNMDLNVSTATKNLTTINLGSGNDTVTIGAATKKAVVNGGAGQDELVIDKAAGTYTLTTNAVETVTVDHASGNVTLEAAGAQGLEKIVLLKQDAHTAKVNGFTGELTVDVKDDATGKLTFADAKGLTLNVGDEDTDASVASVVTAADATEVALNIGAKGSFDGGALAVNKAQVVTITSEADDDISLAANTTMTALESLTVTTAKAFETAAAATIGGDTDLTVNLSAVEGKGTMTFANPAGADHNLTFTGAKGGNEVAVGDVGHTLSFKNVTFNGGDGEDQLTAYVADDATYTVDTGDGADKLDLTLDSHATKFTLSGDMGGGDDTVTLDADAAAGLKSIDLTGLSNYEMSSSAGVTIKALNGLTYAGGDGKDYVTIGSGTGSAKVTINGSDGLDTYVVDVAATGSDLITFSGLTSGDIIDFTTVAVTKNKAIAALNGRGITVNEAHLHLLDENDQDLHGWTDGTNTYLFASTASTSAVVQLSGVGSAEDFADLNVDES